MRLQRSACGNPSNSMGHSNHKSKAPLTSCSPVHRCILEADMFPQTIIITHIHLSINLLGSNTSSKNSFSFFKWNDCVQNRFIAFYISETHLAHGASMSVEAILKLSLLLVVKEMSWAKMYLTKCITHFCFCFSLRKCWRNYSLRACLDNGWRKNYKSKQQNGAL